MQLDVRRLYLGEGYSSLFTNIELRCRAHNAYEASLFFEREREPVVEIPAT